MSSLETRLQETENALQASLLALQSVDGIENINITIPMGPSTTTQRTLSKNEKQLEWKRMPLQSVEDLAAWLKQKHEEGKDHSLRQQSTVEEASAFPPIDLGQPEVLSRRPSSPDFADILGKLESCTMPSVPNAFNVPSASVRWQEHYF